MMAFENPHVHAEMIEANEFPELSDKYSVFGVPKTAINGGNFIEGAAPEKQFVDRVLQAVK